MDQLYTDWDEDIHIFAALCDLVIRSTVIFRDFVHNFVIRHRVIKDDNESLTTKAIWKITLLTIFIMCFLTDLSL